MLVETANGLYEVRTAEQVYRLVEHDPLSGLRTLTSWLAYDRLGPVEAGEPMRFFVSDEERGRSLRFHIVTTSPVTRVRAA